MPLTDKQKVVRTLPTADFPGVFCRQGAVDCRPAFQYRPDDPQRKVPPGPNNGRKHLLVLDDVNGVDQDGERTKAFAGRCADFAVNRLYKFQRAGNVGGMFWPGRGALLEMRDVTLLPGESVEFNWMMITPTNAGENFAAFLPCPDDRAPADPGSPESPQLWSSNQVSYRADAFQPKWTPVQWSPGVPFTGTLRWVVMSGELITDGSRATQAKYAWPATLLIDGLDIV